MQRKEFGELQEVGPIEIGEIKDVLSSIDEQRWIEDTFRQTMFDVHRDTETLFGRWHYKDNEEVMTLVEPFFNELKDTIVSCLQLTNPQISRFCFAKLKANKSITEHVDAHPDLRAYQRIHVPIVTNPGVVTTINGTDFFMKEGMIYNFNNTLKHGIRNESSEDRIHCIIDIESEAELIRKLGPDYKNMFTKEFTDMRNEFTEKCT